MRLHILAVGKRMPSWTSSAFEDYAKRFKNEFSIQVTEINTAKRHHNTSSLICMEAEGKEILTHISSGSFTVALNVTGKMWSTEELSCFLQKKQESFRTMHFIIGGPDGLSKKVLENADTQWSLSPLTLPHPLVRIILIEQLYRAVSILNNHPYHRGE